MSRKAIKTLTPTLMSMRAAILKTVDELFTEHGDKIQDHIDESDDKAATVNFACALDSSTAEPTVKTRIRFSQSVTDMRLARIDDPNQQHFNLFDQQDLDAEKKEREAAENKQLEDLEKANAGAAAGGDGAGKEPESGDDGKGKTGKRKTGGKGKKPKSSKKKKGGETAESEQQTATE